MDSPERPAEEAGDQALVIARAAVITTEPPALSHPFDLCFRFFIWFK